ncbi:MAG TPA: DUF5916 domain-containing protein [Chitinophagaceae bacterium]
MKLKRLLCLPFIFLCIQSFSQQTLQATRTDHAPKIDGNLQDAAWGNVPVATDFIQNFPVYGQKSSVKTEVKIIYDNNAVYVGAYLYDDPLLIRKQLTARDEEQQSNVDFFSIFLDTYNDKQNGFQFLVTSMNVQTDARLGPNLETGFNSYGDKTWDAVWESNVSMQKDGWCVEMRIPYTSLRFAKKDVQVWGLQLLRFTRRNNESSFFNKVNPNANGFVNQFGLLQPLENLQPPLRLSFSPYVSGGLRVSPENGSNKTEWLRSGGMDVKYGINESFTLDATLIPDFGQVISDNVINNLTPYEIRFDENRPFFTEGTELFNKAGLFYSRRIGNVPAGYSAVKRLAANNPDLEITKNPTITQLYNAIKLSGRTEKKLGIGVFNAVTAPMHAIVRDKDAGGEVKIETEPFTNYNIVVLDQSLKGRSYVTFTNTNVIRNGSERDANVTAVDFSLFDKKNVYNVKGTGRYSRIFGANEYGGYNTSLRAGKVSGKTQYYLQGSIISEKYDPRDLGYLAAANQLVYTGAISYNQISPTNNFITYKYNLYARYERLYEPNEFASLQLEASAFYVFKNFWDVTLYAGSFPYDSRDYYVLNVPARYVKRPAYQYARLSGSTDSRKKLFFSYDFLKGFFKGDKDYSILGAGVRYRFSNRFSLDVSTRREKETDYILYAGKELNGEPIIGFVDFTDMESLVTGTYNFTSRLNIAVRTRHYWSNVIFNRFANVSANGDAIDRPFIMNQNENVNIFNVDAFLTWDFRLGSRIILGYKNWLGGDEFIDGIRYKNYLSNFGQTFNLRHGNEFTFRFIYYLDYNQLRRKK